ncbi:hypothetical protein QMK19_03535 [Streptomyces sp. H10-C2]|uniref:hypothetical protein n=1 Tax=unclassified Streptomyces TaxID=2593676 RepID=UPI0024BA471D|nr:MULTISPECIES: hypothetical protein [unclassified Streptomyces]MDJ0342259.1 hypothetical protein [Streptomyces sp. PH10-H1]MDJ0368773.1 hypothetical protein [Streptomyces sp. H10-C2]
MKLDWDAGHGPVTGPINTACGALAVAWAGHVAHMPASWAGLAAGAGWLGTHIAGVRRDLPRTTLVLRAAGWIAAGSWCSLAIANGPWTHWSLGALAAGALGLGAAMAGVHNAEERADERKAEEEVAARRASLEGKRQEIASEWEQRIARVCNGAAVQIVNVEDWATGAGITLDGELPQGGTTWKTIAAMSDALAADAKLAEGCGIEVTPGANRGAVLLNVATKNALLADADYPADYSPLSLNDPSPHGVYRTGEIAAPVMRQRSCITAGRRGSGKTNLMNVKIANQCRMVDNLIWVIDLNGGGLALAWLHAWHQAGRPGRPPIDWVADTPEKANAMVDAMLRIAKARKPGYKHLEIQANDDKLPISPQVPGITLNNDEIAELFSPRARRDLLLREVGDTIVQNLEIARAVALNIENAALRATQDVVSEPQIIKQSALKIALKSDEAEMAYLFGWGDKASPEEAPYPGCGFMKIDDEPARPFKGFRIKPNQIADIVIATADRRPELDDLSRRAAGEAYENRWDGTDHLFGTGPAPTPTPVKERPPVNSDRPDPTANWGNEPSGKDAAPALDEADRARDRLRQAMGEAGDRDPNLEKQFRDILGNGFDWINPTTSEQPPTEDPNDGQDPRRKTVFAIVEKAGPKGIGPTAIQKAFGQDYPELKAPHATVIGRWLDADPRIHKTGYGRYAVRPDQS